MRIKKVEESILPEGHVINSLEVGSSTNAPSIDAVNAALDTINQTLSKSVTNVLKSTRVQAQTVDVDVSSIVNSGAFAYLVVCRSWVADTGGGSLYLVHGIQSNKYMNCIEIVKETNGASVSISNTTLTITFRNSDGGGYAIIPLIQR